MIEEDWWVEKAKQPVVFGRSEEEMEDSTPLQRRQGVANASNCGHFYNDFSGLRVPTATGGGVTFGPYQSLGGREPSHASAHAVATAEG